jgi:plasmid maintenance system killer protein
LAEATDKFSQLYGHQSLGLHPLKGYRSGQYAIIITGNNRLIIEIIEEDLVRIVNVDDGIANPSLSPNP